MASWLRGGWCLVVLAAIVAPPGVTAQTDLDAFMREVLATRDQNWKKLQQYILDEHEAIDVRGPGRVQLWGERRDYTWYIRDGFFVRSPVKFNGVAISSADRDKYEKDFLERQRRRERRRGENQPAAEPGAVPGDVEGLLRQTREPAFISSAYFLRFRFDEGKYALVGRETIDGRELLRVEYYPTNLFRMSTRRRDDRSEDHKAYDAALQRMMNKTSVVTLWIEPKAHQIVKYTFDNVALDFLPAQWLMHVDELHATMTMGLPFPGNNVVWLPAAIQIQGAMTLAVGQFDVRYGIDYHDYRVADVTTKVTIPKSR